MSCSPSSSSSCGEQQSTKAADSEDDKESGICSLSCLVTSCLCTSSSCSVSNSSSPTSVLPFLRPSLFSNVPPTIHFYIKGSKVTKPNRNIRTKLTWCYNSLLPVVMRQCLSVSHFTVVDEATPWIGYWGRHLKSNQYRTIQPFQKVNHFPGAFHMGRKDRLWQHIQEMMHTWGSDEYHIMPTTYILPREYRKLRAYLRCVPPRNVIVKPPASARGAGISIASRIRQIPSKTPLVAQHYVERPLIINGAKFDLRLYVYVTSLDPLRIYLYRQGLVRFASVPYSSSQGSMSNKFMHLTNYSINKLAQVAGESETPVPKWRLTDLWTHIAGFVDVNLVQQRIVDVIIKAVLACESSIRAHQRKHSLYTFTSHELYGMDILLDDVLKPWLLEVNISPSLHSGTSVDVNVKAPLAKDVLNLCGVQLPPHQGSRSSLTIDYAVKPFFGFRTGAELEKEEFHVEYYVKHGKINRTIVEDLTGSDIRMLVDFEDELSRAGNFELLFPTAENVGYMKYFREPIYSNLLLMQWQLDQCCSEGREKGRGILEELCRNGEHHSRVILAEPSSTFANEFDELASE